MPIRLLEVVAIAVVIDADQRNQTMSSEVERQDRKQPYQPPRLVAISLRPEEAVLGHCKIAGGTGPTATTSPCEILLGGCLSIGS